MSAARAHFVSKGKEFLACANWAVAGDVLNAEKPAARVVSSLQAAGKTVHLINPRDKSGQCHAGLTTHAISRLLKAGETVCHLLHLKQCFLT